MLGLIVKNAAVQTVGKVVTVGMSLVVTAWLTRKLGTEIYGKYVLITAMITMLGVVADFGTKIIGVREMAKNERDRKIIWQQLFWLRLGLGLAAGGLGWWLAGWWKGFEGIENEVRWGAAMMVGTAVAGSLEIIWQEELRMAMKTGMEVLYVGLFMAGVGLSKGEITLLGVFQGYLAARVVSLVWGLVRERKWLSGKIKIEGKLVRKLVSQSWPMGLYLLIFTGYDRAVDSLMIERFLGVREVGWYGLAYKMYSTLLQPAYYFAGGVFPVLSEGKISRRKLMIKAGWLTTIAVTGLMMMVWLAAPVMVEILGGKEFEPTIEVLRILAIAMVFSYLGHLSGFGLISMEGQKEILGLGIVSLAFNIGANLIFIPRYGIIGAAWVTVATEVLSLALGLWQLKRKTRK